MIGKFDDYFVPVLKVLNTEGALHRNSIKDKVAISTNATPEDLQYANDRGTLIFSNRVGWAIQYLFQAGAIERTAKAVYAINSMGKELLTNNPDGFTEKLLLSTPGFQAWQERSNLKKEKRKNPELSEVITPQEKIEESLDEIEASIASELVQRIQEMPSEFLERIVLQLLERMGYGDGKGSLKHVGGPGDQGVDGEIKQDRLGIQRIYVQAKRYKTGSNISQDSIQAFMGALSGQGASGGIFITTSDFTKDALAYVQKTMNQKIVLINGDQLGKLLIEHQVGTTIRRTYNVMEIDENFFEE